MITTSLILEMLPLLLGLYYFNQNLGAGNRLHIMGPFNENTQSSLKMFIFKLLLNSEQFKEKKQLNFSKRFLQ